MLVTRSLSPDTVSVSLKPYFESIVRHAIISKQDETLTSAQLSYIGGTSSLSSLTVSLLTKASTVAFHSMCDKLLLYIYRLLSAKSQDPVR